MTAIQKIRPNTDDKGVAKNWIGDLQDTDEWAKKWKQDVKIFVKNERKLQRRNAPNGMPTLTPYKDIVAGRTTTQQNVLETIPRMPSLDGFL